MSMRLDYLCYIGKVKNRTEKTYIYINYPSIYIYIYIYIHIYIYVYIYYNIYIYIYIYEIKD